MAIKFLNTVAVDTSVLYVNAANNRVGINTISPDNTLSVGDGTVDESLAVYHSDGTFTRINGYGLYMSRTASYIRPTSGNSQTLSIGNVTKPWSGVVYNANTHYFRSGANENMRITSTGDVGIGTTSPGYTLAAYANTTGSKVVASFGSALDQNQFTAIGLSGFIASNGATKAGIALKRTGVYGTGELHFLNNNTLDNSDITLSDSKMMIDDTGNVGIGTTSPGSPLEINGVGTGSGVGEGIRVTREGVNGQYISIDEADGSRHRIRAIGDKPFDIFSSASSYGINLHTNSLQRMTITNTGYVGIGTTDPNAKLHVVNGSSGQTYSNVSGALIDVNGTSNSYSALRVGSSAGNNHLVVTNAGKVGIGATSPNEKLSVDTGSNGSAGYISVDSQTLTRLKLGYSFTSSPSAITAAQIYADSSGNLDISSRGNAASAIQLYTSSGTSPSERMRITSDGKVGIGTTSPNAKLDIISGTNNGIRISATDTSSVWRDIDIKSYVSQAQANAFPDGSAIYTTNPSGQTETAFSKYGGLVIQGRDDGNSSFAIRLGNGSGYATRMFMGETGATVFSNQVTATNFITSSDERLKENIKEAFGDKVEVNWKTFELKTDKGHKRYGVIAQDLEKNHPEFVKTDNEGMKSVAYTDLLIAKIAELENRIQTLENK